MQNNTSISFHSLLTFFLRSFEQNNKVNTVACVKLTNLDRFINWANTLFTILSGPFYKKVFFEPNRNADYLTDPYQHQSQLARERLGLARLRRRTPRPVRPATMGTAAVDLEARQLRILGRIADLELAVQQRRLGALSISAAPPEDGEAEAGATEAQLSALLVARGVRDFAFRRVPADYYDRPLEERRGLLRADSVAQLCKSIVMVRGAPFPFRA